MNQQRRAVGAANPNNNGRGPAQRERTEYKWTTLIYGVGVYLVLSLVLGSLLGGMMAERDKKGSADDVPATTAAATAGSEAVDRGHLRPLARRGVPFSIRVSSPDGVFEPVVFTDVPFSTTVDTAALTVTRELRLADVLRRNASSEALIQWSMLGHTFEDSFPIVKSFAERKQEELHHLVKGGQSDAPQGTAADASGATTHSLRVLPELTLSPVVDFTAPLPVQFRDFTPVMEEEGLYGPAVYINTFWTLKEHWRVLNETSAAQPLSLRVSVSPLPPWKVSMYFAYEATMKSQIDMGLATEDSKDETKRIFIETNPYFLGLTALVTVLHVIFEYMAFSNDVRFWRGRKDFKGLSLRTIAVSCYSQTVIFLYLLDGGETSWTILVPAGLGVLMEYWKLTKTTRIVPVAASAGGDAADGARAPKGIALFGYRLQFSASYDRRTRKHDDTAVKYIGIALVPLLAGYSVYSLLYKTHKSWYSFCIGTQVQFIYFFGFLMMTPQIFINYKMKSVGQLPWRTFVYKSLNTVIDDLFAFIIKMPWMHRVACFRDDVVFAILLYQRWIYPVDMNRLADSDGGEEEEEGERNGGRVADKDASAAQEPTGAAAAASADAGSLGEGETKKSQ